MLLVPIVSLDLAKNNFVFQSSYIWNDLNKKVLSKCTPNEKGIIIPGSSIGSDTSASMATVKRKLREILLNTQKINSLQSDDWVPSNFYNAHYPV